MEKVVKTQLTILNLAGTLSEELINYFVQKEISLNNPEDFNSPGEWTHIITRDLQDFKEIKEKYKLAQIVSLSAIDDLQDFVLCNGKLVLDEMWMKNSIGPLILDKFFQEYGGISLEDNYPVFEERGSFNITNPFNTGEYLDRLVHSAYKDGMSGLSIKTFFDHLVMYLTGLKSQGKVGMPIEVMYGCFENVFAVQLHFYTKNLILEDVTTSLSSNISKEAEKYLLNIAVKSSDFFDFTLLSEVNKTVVTGFWTKDEKIKTKNQGMLFSELTSEASLSSYPTKGVTSFQTVSSELTDFSEKIVVSSDVSDEDEAAQVISGTVIEEEIINIVKGNFKNEEAVFKISGSGQFDIDKFAYRVSAGIEDQAKGNNFLKIKSLKNGLPEAIKNNFHTFASSLNKTLDQISEEDLENFKNHEIPRIIKDKTKKIDQQVTRIPKDSPTVFEGHRMPDKDLEVKFATIKSENDLLKSKMKTLVTEVKILKDSKAQMALIQAKALAAASDSENESSIQQAIQAKTEQDLKSQIINKMIAQNSLNEEDTHKLKELMSVEAKLLAEAKDNENQIKKYQIEIMQKETMFAQEMEKLARALRAKDLVIMKSKENLTKIMDQKDREISLLNSKMAQVTEAMLATKSQNHGQQIRDLEKQVSNQEKMIEIYKSKITNKPSSEIDETATKEENKRLHMTNAQMKNQIEAARKEIVKLQERMSQDSKAINLLKVEKAKVDQILKKMLADDAKRDGAANLSNQSQEKELRKLQSQQEQFVNEIKESQLRQKDLEARLAEALKNQKKEEVQETPANARGKTAHLENNVRKLTQDLIESRNQTAEMKKDTMKMRQEKTAIQNQLDQMKKELDKLKDASHKKTGNPGKAA